MQREGGRAQGQRGDLSPAGSSPAPGTYKSRHLPQGCPQWPWALPGRRGQRQCCHCHCFERLVVLCCPLGQATGTDADDASTNFTDSIKEEAAHGVATQHVSQGSVVLAIAAAELGTAPLPDCVLVPSEMSPVTLCLCPSRAAPGPLRKAGALKGPRWRARYLLCRSGSCGQKRSCGS